MGTKQTSEHNFNINVMFKITLMCSRHSDAVLSEVIYYVNG
jgi:hypothetical protein